MRMCRRVKWRRDSFKNKYGFHSSFYTHLVLTFSPCEIAVVEVERFYTQPPL